MLNGKSDGETRPLGEMSPWTLKSRKAAVLHERDNSGTDKTRSGLTIGCSAFRGLGRLHPQHFGLPDQYFGLPDCRHQKELPIDNNHSALFTPFSRPENASSSLNFLPRWRKRLVGKLHRFVIIAPFTLTSQHGCTTSRREAWSPRGKPRCPAGRQTSSASAARSYSSGRTKMM